MTEIGLQVTIEVIYDENYVCKGVDYTLTANKTGNRTDWNPEKTQDGLSNAAACLILFEMRTEMVCSIYLLTGSTWLQHCTGPVLHWLLWRSTRTLAVARRGTVAMSIKAD